MPTEEEYRARIEALDWNGLRTLWQAVKNRDTPGWEAGKAFEYLVLRAFQLDKADVTWPYSVELFEEEVEQIDGAVYAGGLSCLVESKDFEKNIAIGPLAKMRNQLLRRPTGTIGLMFSSSRYTAPAIFLAHFSLPQAILLWEGAEVEFVLNKETICGLLQVKYRACVEHGMPDFDVTGKGI